MKLGMLFSLTGLRGEMERSILDGALLAVDEVNRAGGAGGEQLEPVIVDCRSDLSRSVRGVAELRDAGVRVIVGGYTSATRTALLPAVRDSDALLLYPTYFEGEETDPNVFYCGGAPNQFVGSYLGWIAENLGARAYLVGSDYVYPRILGEVIGDLGRQLGMQVVGDWYSPLGETGFGPVVDDVRRTAPDVVICNLVGAESTAGFYSAFHRAGLRAGEVPIAATVTTEVDLAHMPVEASDGHFMSATYFAGIDSPGNEAYRSGLLRIRGQRWAHAAQVGAYNAVHAAASAYGRAGHDGPESMREALLRVRFDANPEGVPFAFDDDHYSTHPSYVARAEGGAYEVIAQFGARPPRPWWSGRNAVRGGAVS